MSSGSLLLHPADPSAAPSIHQAEKALKHVGLLGRPLENTADAWFVGDAFLQLITFMGCSPYIELEPVEAGRTDFCHIRIHTHSTPTLMFGKLTKQPKCPSCRKALSETPEQIARFLSNDGAVNINCPHCDQQFAPVAALWRQDGGVARLFVEITNIFPGEAVPVDSLLRHLAELTNGTWTYCYVSG